tara:strand:+ start:649 stop:1323 length:675 start_codon:yes stop_codon:yes gene_type:complete
MKIISIIPARGGSKGIPKKNIKKILDLPLITHSINYSLSSNKITTTYVSTDDPEIKKISKKAGASVIDRPKNIAGDTATTESAIEHALLNITIDPDIIILLQPTSPFRPNKSLDKAIDHFILNKYDSLLSISPTHNFIWKIKNDIAIPKYDYLNRPRRQDIKQHEINFIENGSLYIFTKKHFNNYNNRLGGKIGYVIFDEKFSKEIDTELDFTILEQINKKFNS